MVRLRPKRSQTNDTLTSEMDMVLVSAANSNSRKKSMAQSCGAGMEAKTSGKVTKTSVVPLSPSPSRPKLITAGKIFKMTLSNKVRFIKYMSGTDAEILEYIVAPESAITHKTLKDTDFPHDAIIGGIIRGNESFIAVGDTKIEAYDRVVVFSLPNAVKDVDRLFR